MGFRHHVPVHMPNLCQAQAGKRALHRRDIPQSHDRTASLQHSTCFLPSFCFLYLFIFILKLEGWLPEPSLCWEPCPGEGRSQPSPLVLMLLQGEHDCAQWRKDQIPAHLRAPLSTKQHRADQIPKGWFAVGYVSMAPEKVT